MAATIGKLNVQLTSNTARFRSDMSRAGKGVDGLKKRLGGLDKAMAIYRAGMASMATAAAAATAASAAMVKRQMGTIDALGKTSAKLGIEVAELQRLHHAAELTGASIETVNMSLQRMSRRLAEAARGTGEARGVLGELGLDPKKLVAASPGTAFREIADRLGKVKTQYDKLRIAQKLFDSEGVALVNTLALGKRGLVAAGKEADRLGVTLAPGATGKVEAANDSLHRLKTALAGAANAITADVAPAITVLANEMARLAANMNKVGAAGGFIDKVADVLHTVKIANKAGQAGAAKIGETIAGQMVRFDKWADSIMFGDKRPQSYMRWLPEMLQDEFGKLFQRQRADFNKAFVAKTPSEQFRIEANRAAAQRERTRKAMVPTVDFSLKSSTAEPTGRTSGPFSYLADTPRQTFAELAVDKYRDRLSGALQGLMTTQQTPSSLADLAMRGSAAANTTISRAMSPTAAKQTEKELLETARKQLAKEDKIESTIRELLEHVKYSDVPVLELSGVAR